MTSEKKLSALFLCAFVFLCTKKCDAQYTRKLELSIVPALGFNLSFPVLLPHSIKKNFDARGLVSKDLFGGIGVQMQLWDQWQVTLKIANSAYGNRWKYRSINGGNYASGINLLDLTTEKKVYTSGSLKFKNLKARLCLQALAGIRYVWISKVNRSDSLEELSYANFSGLSQTEYIKQRRNATGALSAGLNVQLYVNEHRSLKIGAMYSYSPTPIFENQINFLYFNGDKEQFKTYVGHHQLLFYAEYPILFLSRKLP